MFAHSPEPTKWCKTLLREYLLCVIYIVYLVLDEIHLAIFNGSTLCILPSCLELEVEQEQACLKAHASSEKTVNHLRNLIAHNFLLRFSWTLYESYHPKGLLHHQIKLKPIVFLYMHVIQETIWRYSSHLTILKQPLNI